MIRIGFIGSGLNLLSGSGYPTFQLMGKLKERGIETGMLSDNLSDSISSIHKKLLDKHGLICLDVKRIEPTLLKGLIRNDKIVASSIEDFSKNFDIMITGDFFLAWLLKRNKIAIKAPIIFLASNNYNFKLSYLINSGLAALTNIIKPSFLSKLLLPDFMMNRIISDFDYIIATSIFSMNNLKKSGISANISYLPVGVNINSTFVPFDSDEDRFLYFGWGSGIRGIQDVLRAFESYKKLGYNGSLKVCLQGHHGIEESFYLNKIKNSKFLDFIELGFFNERIYEDILSSKAIVLPFRTPFGYSQPPITLLECMALGRVVISTRIGCIPELINDGIDGYLTNPARPDELLNIMASLEKDRINYIGRNAFNKMAKSYSWDELINMYLLKFKEVLNAR